MAGSDPSRTPGTTRLGSYEIARLIARGGMAEIYLAQAIGPEGFAKLVVLKKILPQFAASSRFVQLFLDEARLAAALDHPHIAHVYDMGTVGGDYFFTMEYVHGQDMRSIMRRATDQGTHIPIDHVVLVASTVAGALHYAHEQRGSDGASLAIVHRDVSPSNILISYDGTVKLVDFGVAKAATSSAKTRTGSIKGKVAYMSPEQASGFPIDRRSDIFSLGIVMWELVTGIRLFKEDNDLASIRKIVSCTPPPPTQHRADCPPELERIIMRALSKAPDDRYQTAEALQLELEELAREHRLSQSSVALRAHIHTLFAEELAAWQDAQSRGTSLAQHVTNHPELTTPLVDSGYLIDDDEAEYPTTALPAPIILRPDGTPMPVMQWSAQHALPETTSPSLANAQRAWPREMAPEPASPQYAPPAPSLARAPRRNRLLWIGAAAGTAMILTAAVIAVSVDRSAPQTETVRMQASPSPLAPTTPPAAVVPSVPAAPVAAPEAEPAPVADAKPVVTAPVRNAPPRTTRKSVKPAKPAPPKPPPPKTVQPKPKQPKPPAFDPNDPLPPKPR